MTPAPATRSRVRLTLVVLLVVFLAPVAGGWLWFHLGGNFPQKNHGALYDPARPLESIVFTDGQGAKKSLADLRGNWLLAYVGRGECGDDCLTRLDAISRVRISLSKNIKRVTPVYLTGAEPGAAALEQIRMAMPVGVIARVDAANAAALDSLLAREGENPAQVLQRVYLIDPIGNLVLSYEPGADPAGIRKDLARLLRVSQIG